MDYILQQLDAQRSIFSAFGESDHAAQLSALSARLNDRILAFGTAAATRDITPALYGGLSGAFDAIAMAVADIRDALPEDKKALIPDMGALESRREAMIGAAEKAMAAPPRGLRPPQLRCAAAQPLTAPNRLT